jgi:sec-independent protein translocase protein TatA
MRFGPTEILLVLVVLLLLFGGRKLPELAKGLGKSLRIFKEEIKNPDDKSDTDNQK